MQILTTPVPALDVLCVGHASWDLIFSVDHHPHADEKIFAQDLLSCGGGPAANAALTVARLGYKAGFAGYLGSDGYGTAHYQELCQGGVITDYVRRGDNPTPLSVVLVKPDGQRALINYRGATQTLAADAINLPVGACRVMLFDGHEPDLSVVWLEQAKADGIMTVLDAGSWHRGTQLLWNQVDYLVASEKFAAQWSGHNDAWQALQDLSAQTCCVVITLGERGLIWRRGDEQGELAAFQVDAVDTTGAGDVFHGAFAAGLAAGMPWFELLQYASAAGALCCTRIGARLGIPHAQELAAFYMSRQ